MRQMTISCKETLPAPALRRLAPKAAGTGKAVIDYRSPANTVKTLKCPYISERTTAALLV
jgi:hypothetical protein